MKTQTIYLDHAATTPVRPAVLEAMVPYFTEVYGNPSSIHRTGRGAGVALQKARQTVADLLGARPSEIIFTGCGTESDNAALHGIALARRAATGANQIITTPIEHKAVLQTAAELQSRYGFTLTLLPVDCDGRVPIDALERALAVPKEVAVVSIMAANNEVGTIEPISELGALCRAVGVPFHTDAVQVGGKLDLALSTLSVDAMSLSAHKFYGPKGVGLLYLRAGTPFYPFMIGGSHESGRRAGTENVPLIVGMAKALELAEAERLTEGLRLRTLRDRLIGGVLACVEGATLTGSATLRLDNHASFVIDGADAEGMLIALDLAGVAASSGSACASGANQPSHVLHALGISPARAAGALRFSLGAATSADEIDFLLDTLPRIVDRVRG